MSPPKYSAGLARIVNAYIEAVVARASGSPDYDAAAHARALDRFDTMLARLEDADDLMTFLDDWFSGGHEIVIAGCFDRDGVRCDREGTRDRLWVVRSHHEEGDDETVRDALREYMRECFAATGR